MPADTGGTFHAAAEAAAWRKTQDLPADVGKVELIEGAVDPVLIRLLHREDAALLAVDAHSRNRLHAALVGRIAAQLKRDLPSDLPIVRAD